jgi:cytochrome bd-type quinol oxidase subunit 2
MLIKTFWKILIKIIGLWILFGCISVIPQFFSTVSFTDGNLNIESLMLIWLMLFATIIVYILVIRLFLFKTDWIIEKLKLDKNFTEERIDLNIKSSTVLTIAIIIIGGLIITESLPNFCSRLFDFFQQKSLLKEYHDTSWLIYYFIKIIIGYLLLTNGKNLTKYIEKNSSEENVEA